MARKKVTFAPEMKIRIKKTSTMSLIEKLYETGKYSSANAIVNAGLEQGLPVLTGDKSPVDSKELASLVSEEIMDKLVPLSNSILFNLRKIAVLQTVQEAMLSSILQELEFFLQTKGIVLDEELLTEFKDTLPERFEEDKQELIVRLLKAEERSRAESEEADGEVEASDENEENEE